MNYKELLDDFPIFSKISAVARKGGFRVYVVGGFVRDLFLKRRSKDLDILCVGDGVEFAHYFAKEMGNLPLHIFKNFQTAMVEWQGWQIEIVGARKESYSAGSRNPVVTKGTMEDDIYRRDFTINAIALGLNGDNFGELIDKTYGLKDLDGGIIRTPRSPEKTFSDDPLRMLRGIRFAHTFGFTIEKSTWAAMKKESSRLCILSKERIMDEFHKMLLNPRPSKALYMLDEANLLPHILPEMEALKGVERIGRHTHKDNFIHTLQVVDNVAEASKNLWLRWAALLHDIAKPKTKGFDAKIGFTFHGHEVVGAKMVGPIFRRLKLPLKQEMRYVKKLIRLHLRHISLLENQVTDSAIRRFIYDAGEELEDLIILFRSDITSGNPKKVTQYLANFEKLAQMIAQVEEKDRIRKLEPVIGGEEIMKAFGIGPSRPIGTIKAALKEAILEEGIENSHDVLYPRMLDLGKSLGLTPK